MESGDKKNGINRRKLMLTSLAAGGLGALGMHERSAGEDKRRVEALRARDAEPKIATFLHAEKKPVPQDTSLLEGYTLKGEFAEIMGIEGKVGGVALVDFKYQLAHLLQRKLALIQGEDEDGDFDLAHGEGILAALEGLYRSYRPDSLQTLGSYRTGIENTVQATIQLLQPEKVQRYFKLNDAQRAFFERAAQSIDGNTLLSCALAEVMYTENAQFNTKAFDFLLKTAGSDYVERIPALGDRLLSFGPYQFTSIAHYHGAKEGIKEYRVIEQGSAKMDGLLRQRTLPPNIVSFRGEDHHRAAYLLGLYNLVLLAKIIGEPRLRKMERYPQEIAGALPSYIAGAHHTSKYALAAFGKYVDTLGVPAQKKPTFQTCCGLLPRLQTYVRKAELNRNYLAQHVR